MKALSLWQPWASLMQIGAKTIETRSWYTNYRGPLLICSTKGGLSKRDLVWTLNQNKAALKKPLISKFEEITVKNWSGKEVLIPSLPLGKALCIVDLVDVIPTDEVDFSSDDYNAHEYVFGDYSEGRFAWITKNRRPIEPIPITGRQGLFNVPEELQSQFKYIEL